MSDTIFALSSGQLPSAVAVVRVSGPAAGALAGALTHSSLPPRRATLVSITDPRTGDLVDRGLAILFPSPESFTGEDCLELQVHGGRAVVAALLRVLGDHDGCRPAAAGEFARRAFLNGKLDLTSAEGLADLIEARTSAQHRQALAQAGGALQRQVDAWRSELIGMAASMTALLDFADEGDVRGDVGSGSRDAAARLLASMERVLEDSRGGELVRDGATVVIAGPPNAGKSSLLNALARRDAAIVSSRPGTTRDIIEVAIDLDGVPVVLVDTAGLREVDDEIEMEGMARARRRADSADLVLWLSEDGAPPSLSAGVEPIRIRSKADLCESATAAEIPISTLTGAGLDRLLSTIVDRLGRVTRVQPAIVTQARHRDCLTRAMQALERIALVELDLELAAEDLRTATVALETLVGRVGVEEVLGSVFSRFCIGK